MKKIAFLCLGTLMITGAFLASCGKKENEPKHKKDAPRHMDPQKKETPSKKPCRRY